MPVQPHTSYLHQGTQGHVFVYPCLMLDTHDKFIADSARNIVTPAHPCHFMESLTPLCYYIKFYESMI